MTSLSGPQEHWGCMCLHLVGPGLKSQATKAAAFSVDIFRGRQRPKCWDWRVKESLTKPRRLCSSAQSREEQAFPLAMCHKVSLRNAQVEICFYQPNRSIPLLKYAFFLVIWQRRHGEWARDEATQGKVKEHPWVGWIIKATESHSLSGAPGCCLCKGRPTWRGQEAGTTDNRSSKQESGILPKPCLVFALQDWDTPTPQHCCLTPVPAVGCTRACLNKLVITTLRKPDEPIAAGAGLLQEVPSVDLLIEGHLEHPNGTGLLEKTCLGWPHLCNWWERTTELPQQLEKMNTPLPSHGGWMSLHPDLGWDREQRWLEIHITLICPTDPFINTLKCWHAWTWLSTFPRNFHRNQNTLNHPHSGMAWEMSKALRLST